jgi:hypothetical protein
MPVHGRVALVALVVVAAGSALAFGVARSDPPAAPVDGHRAHRAAPAPVEHDAPSGTHRELAAQLRQTQALVARYPTVAAAEAAGYRRSGAFAPGLGAHYVNEATVSLNDDGVMDRHDLAAPELIFDGLGPDARLAGFMYLARTETEPEGFAGHDDHWHAHTNLCVVERDGVLHAPIGADAGATESECSTLGGVFYPRTAYMLHVWTVPGFESPLGVFSETNPALTCPDGSAAMVDPATLGFAPTACQNP